MFILFHTLYSYFLQFILYIVNYYIRLKKGAKEGFFYNSSCICPLKYLALRIKVFLTALPTALREHVKKNLHSFFDEKNFGSKGKILSIN